MISFSYQFNTVCCCDIYTLLFINNYFETETIVNIPKQNYVTKITHFCCT